MEIKNVVTGFILFSLFGLLLISFVAEMGTLHNVDMDEITEHKFKMSNFTDTIPSTEETQSLREQMTKGTIDDLESAMGIKSIAEKVSNYVIAPFRLTFIIAVNVLGIPTWFADTILVIFVIGIILGLWALFKIGR